MRILIDVGHPKDVNVFRHSIYKFQKDGHQIKIVVRAKENTCKLLDDLGFEYETLPHFDSMHTKLLGIAICDILLYKISLKFKPGIFLSAGSPYSAHVSALIRKPHLAFIDTEIAGLANKLMIPFTDKIYTSSSFYKELGKKQVRFNGLFELAYLHPNYFIPDKNVLDKYGLNEDYLILRLSSLSSHHDLHAKGFNFKDETDFLSYLSQLEEHGRVVIFSEFDDWSSVNSRKLNIDSLDLHSILYYSKLYIGEGASMAAEAAVLGVPSIYVSTTRRGYLNDLESSNLVFTFDDKCSALNKANNILSTNSSLESSGKYKEKYLQNKDDVVELICNSICEYKIDCEKNGT